MQSEKNFVVHKTTFDKKIGQLLCQMNEIKKKNCFDIYLVYIYTWHSSYIDRKYRLVYKNKKYFFFLFRSNKLIYIDNRFTLNENNLYTDGFSYLIRKKKNLYYLIRKKSPIKVLVQCAVGEWKSLHFNIW